ncbi:MAG: alpha/beta hydrolase domain-containing protein [Candidatus Binatia bacterium]
MKARKHARWALAVVLFALCRATETGAAEAPLKAAGAVERIEVVKRQPAFGGASFGNIGVYERIDAVAYLKIDPRHPANAGIVDLDKAPRHNGWVSYSTDLVILRPIDGAKARRVLVFEVANRGTKVLLQMLNDVARPGELMTAEESGQGFLMRQGYTVVFSGWQGDLDASADPRMREMFGNVPLIKAHLPVARNGKRSIVGMTQTEVVFDNLITPTTISLVYPAATLDQTQATLTVRARQRDVKREIARDHWRYVNDRSVQLDRPADMDAGAIYEFVYRARDPIVMGLGFAVTRDLVSFLRYEQKDSAGNPSPLADLSQAPCEVNGSSGRCALAGAPVDLAIAIGASQSGRYLRDFTWQGFNADGSGRRVFDGMIPIVAGARQTFTNVRWAQPGRFSRQHEEHLVYGNQFPFTYATTTDPVTGKRDGILARCSANQTCPRLFHIDTAAEFRTAGAALVGTDGAGRDVAFPENVRAYMIASGTHYPGGTLPACQYQANPMQRGAPLRAALVAMTDWVAGRTQPPPSRWPSIAGGTLADPASQAAVGFPDLFGIGMPYSPVVNGVEVADYTNVPPQADYSRSWKILVPTTDADGNDIGGIRLPDIAAPVGTYLGWNVRRKGYAEGELCLVVGSFKPFAADAATRSRDGDPRLSLAERYAGKADYINKVRQAAASLRDEGFLLGEDVDRYVARAAAGDSRWRVAVADRGTTEKR